MAENFEQHLTENSGYSYDHKFEHVFKHMGLICKQVLASNKLLLAIVKTRRLFRSAWIF